MTSRGGTVTFNVSALPYSEVETTATKARVSVRGGCFCNPGAAEMAFGLDASRIRECCETLGDTFTPARFAACAKTAVGAVRASIGMANNERDIDRLVAVIASLTSSISDEGSPPEMQRRERLSPRTPPLCGGSV